MNYQTEWTVAISSHLLSINLYTAGAWLYQDERDKSNTCVIPETLTQFTNDYEIGEYSNLHSYVEEKVKEYGFEIVGEWDGLMNKAVKVNGTPEKEGSLDYPVEDHSGSFAKFVDGSSVKNASKALETLFNYSQIDGSHHKDWVMDQVVRSLTGKYYDDFVKYYETDDITGDDYEWETGIAP